MNKELDGLNELVTRIDAKVLEINTKLDELIKALHEYDDDLSTFNDEPLQGPCSKHDDASWDEERMNVIGQNGNEGLHYTDVDENEFDDYGQRVVGDKDKSNDTQPKQKQYYKNNRSKRSGDKKSAVVEHQKHPPHKH